MAIFDHISINVKDYSKSKAFYDKALKPLGVELTKEFGLFGGYGKAGKAELWVGEGKSDFQTEEQVKVITPIHICFVASSSAEVDSFHRAGLEAGGKDNGAPGLRPQYHKNYYGAFIIDPDGHNVEAVYHGGVS